MKIKNFMILVVAVTVVLTGCESNKKMEEGNAKTEAKNPDEVPAVMAEHTEVIKAGDVVVYLDEVRYYAYNTQATYETYYMAEEKELDWNGKISDDVTLEEAVKSTVLDTICEREAIISYADEYNIKLEESELLEISDKANKFFSETNEKFLEKVDVSHERMRAIFEKNALFEKVKMKMEDEESGKSEEAYKNWKKVNTVTTNEYWDAINYDTPIFMSE